MDSIDPSKAIYKEELWAVHKFCLITRGPLLFSCLFLLLSAIMVFIRAFTLATASVLLFIHSLAMAQQLTKPVISPAIDFSQVDQGLYDHLTPTQSTWDQWGPGWIPQACKDLTLGAGFNPTDIEVFNVHYTDVGPLHVVLSPVVLTSFQCGDVWIMCRHHQSPMRYEPALDLVMDSHPI